MSEKEEAEGKEEELPQTIAEPMKQVTDNASLEGVANSTGGSKSSSIGSRCKTGL